jgi:adenylate kinase family enzyme
MEKKRVLNWGAKELDITRYNRIIIVGNSGSGKSFLSNELSTITGLPLIHLDVEYWRPNWEKTPKEEWVKKQTGFVSKEKWIIDGNYNSTMELRYKAADIIIFLDINRFICIVSAFKRHGTKRTDLPQYLEEKLDFEFLQFCKWIWNFSKTGRHTIMELHKKYPDKPFLMFKSRRKLQKMLIKNRR